jgi:hypothetical protein
VKHSKLSQIVAENQTDNEVCSLNRRRAEQEKLIHPQIDRQLSINCSEMQWQATDA